MNASLLNQFSNTAASVAGPRSPATELVLMAGVSTDELAVNNLSQKFDILQNSSYVRA
ncbi:hypothetical protein SynBIOSE41_01568 [Synechococcus sp. BIOS-E4-1]|nr:hypothetical protein SynBIOSE41_01568 [Synechococcus sp. BIOS-E4-1]